MKIKRRDFIKTCSVGLAGISLAGIPSLSCTPKESIPSYLKGYENIYNKDPRAAALQWFRDVKYGLFMHYGISSLLGKGEWVQYEENIPLNEYIKLKDDFTAHNFNADFITDLALEAGMKYVNITSRHHDSFCLFDSKVTNYSSVNSPCKRDLIGKLAEQCSKKGLGLFLYYSYALDWWHPYFYPRKYSTIARPNYHNPNEIYKWRKDEDFQYYIEFVHTQLKELLTNYGKLAGIWFDPIMGYYAKPELFPIEETYKLIRNLQPQTLISFKQGATGTEDFAAPERSGYSLKDNVRTQYDEKRAKIAENAWEMNKNKYNEICDTLQLGAWGYKKSDEGKHRSPKRVVEMLIKAVSNNYNLLLNTGPLPDGSIHNEDVSTLKEVGKWIDQNSDSIYGTFGGPFKQSNLINTTFKSNVIFIHLNKINNGKINLPLDINSIKSIEYLDGTNIKYRAKNKNITLEVASNNENILTRVVKVELTGAIITNDFKDQMVTFEIRKKYNSIELKHSPSSKYSGQGTLTLENGVRGGLEFTDGNWLGFEENNFETTVELREHKLIEKIEIGFLEDQKSWIFSPQKVAIYVSDNKLKWEKIFDKKYDLVKNDNSNIRNIIANKLHKKAKYVKIAAENIGKCPVWHEGAGGKAWIFVDEIFVQ